MSLKYNLYTDQFQSNLVSSPQSHSDRIYIVRDIIMKLVEYGQLNQTALISYCGLNLKKHRTIFDKMELNGLIIKTEKSLGKRTVTVYSASQKGLEFCRTIIEPYEKLFPRSPDTNGINTISLVDPHAYD
jgi:predicted transcriptional regulator